jgi:hypothetical protein
MGAKGPFFCHMKRIKELTRTLKNDNCSYFYFEN